MNRRFCAFFLTLIGAVAIAATTSFAWFLKVDQIDTKGDSGIQGSFFTGYFHDGEGTIDKPFTITRPKHWENLVWLHNNVSGFYNAKGKESEIAVGHGYYFQVGVTGLDGSSTVPQVYAYDDNGEPIMNGNKPTYSTTTLNLKCFSQEGKELIPIGSPQYPFIGALEGNNFSLEGFKIISYDKYHGDIDLEDVGIFGYVGPAYGATEEDPAITNIYFKNYTIDTSSASLDEVKSYIHHPTHTPTEKETEDYYGKAYVGYVAGHINTSDSFENVYVNNCTIEGTADDDCGQLNNYSYFGKVELGKGSSKTGAGNNYSFKLDTKAVYNYLEADYDNIKNNPIATRNANYVINDPDQPMFDGNTTIHPYSEAFAYVTSGFDTYNLIGDDPDDYGAGEYKGHNYSLSTMGYYEVLETGETTTYGLKVKKANGSSYYDIADDTVIQSSLTAGTTGYVEPLSSRLTQFGQSGTYMHYDSDNKTWDYYKVHTHKKDDMRTVNLTFTCNGTFTSSATHAQLSPSYQYASFQVFVDGKAVYSEPVTVPSSYFSISRSNSHMVTTISNFSQTLPQLSLAVGNHTISALIGLRVNRNYFKYSAYYYGSKVELQDGGNDYYITGNSFTIKNTDTTVTKTFALGSCNHSSGLNYETDNPTYYCRDSTSYTPYVYSDSDTVTNPVMATKLYKSGDEFNESNNSRFTVFTDVIFKQFKGTDQEGQAYNYWHGIIESKKQLKSKTPIWMADKINEYYDEGSALYNHENIDVVGGGVRFGNGHITFDGEEERTLVKQIKSGDIGKSFTSTEYCANSIVLYLKNVGGSNPDDIMGEITIRTSWLGLVSLVELLFKKGKGLGTDGGDYVELSDAADAADKTDTTEWISITEGWQRVTKITLRRKYLKNISYCALDKNKNVLVNYNASGEQNLPNATTSPINDRLVDTYVLALGSISDTIRGINCRVDEIDFNYVSRAGFGGSFGSVEYRDRGDTVEDTIMNFYFLIPENDKFRVKVVYSNGRYDITFNYYSATSGSLLVKIYLYDLTFSVYLNNVQYAENGSGEATVPSAQFN